MLHFGASRCGYIVLDCHGKVVEDHFFYGFKQSCLIHHSFFFALFQEYSSDTGYSCCVDMDFVHYTYFVLMELVCSNQLCTFVMSERCTLSLSTAPQCPESSTEGYRDWPAEGVKEPLEQAVGEK